MVSIHQSRLVEQILGFFGVDISDPITVTDAQCLFDHGVSFGIVRCWRSVGLPDPSCPASVSSLWTAGFSSVDIYFFPDTSLSPVTQIEDAFTFLTDNQVQFNTFWLDIERYQWAPNTTWNQAYIHLMASTAESLQLKLGIYSGRSSWSAIMGANNTDYSNLPLWYAHYQKPADPSFDDYYSLGPYGGWINPFMKQYAGDIAFPGCNITQIDLDWRPQL